MINAVLDVLRQRNERIKAMEKATINDFVQARIRKPADGGIPYIEIKRAKYKHWHIIGFHFESDQAFKRALAAGTVIWLPKIIEPPTLFEK